MNIAIYYPWVYLTSGIERTILEITKIKGHQFTIYTNHFDPKHTFPEFKSLKVIELKQVPVERDILSVLKAASIIATQKIDLSQFDLLCIQSDGIGDLIVFSNHQIPIVCFCHTPLRPVFDPYYQSHILNNKSVTYKIIFSFFKLAFRLIDQRAYHYFSSVIFNSIETKNRAIRGGLIKPNNPNTFTIHPGVNWEQIIPQNVSKPYFLLAGRIMWTKQIELAIHAFKRFKKNNPPLKKFKLIIAGQVDKKSQTYFKNLQKLVGKKTDITFVTNPTDQKLHRLYSQSFAVLSCAFNEDWGISLIEGNTHGKPAIGINRGGSRESQHHRHTGLLVNDDPQSIADAFKQLATHPQQAQIMGANARQHVKQFSWSQFRKQIASVMINTVKA